MEVKTTTRTHRFLILAVQIQEQPGLFAEEVGGMMNFVVEYHIVLLTIQIMDIHVLVFA